MRSGAGKHLLAVLAFAALATTLALPGAAPLTQPAIVQAADSVPQWYVDLGCTGQPRFGVAQVVTPFTESFFDRAQAAGTDIPSLAVAGPSVLCAPSVDKDVLQAEILIAQAQHVAGSSDQTGARKLLEQARARLQPALARFKAEALPPAGPLGETPMPSESLQGLLGVARLALLADDPATSQDAYETARQRYFGWVRDQLQVLAAWADEDVSPDDPPWPILAVAQPDIDTSDVLPGGGTGRAPGLPGDDPVATAIDIARDASALGDEGLGQAAAQTVRARGAKQFQQRAQQPRRPCTRPADEVAALAPLVAYDVAVTHASGPGAPPDISADPNVPSPLAPLVASEENADTLGGMAAETSAGERCSVWTGSLTITQHTSETTEKTEESPLPAHANMVGLATVSDSQMMRSAYRASVKVSPGADASSATARASARGSMDITLVHRWTRTIACRSAGRQQQSGVSGQGTNGSASGPATASVSVQWDSSAGMWRIRVRVGDVKGTLSTWSEHGSGAVCGGAPARSRDRRAGPLGSWAAGGVDLNVETGITDQAAAQLAGGATVGQVAPYDVSWALRRR
jgi:hypothetical protein